MRDRDLDPISWQILHRRTAPSQLQIQLGELNRSPHSAALVDLLNPATCLQELYKLPRTYHYPADDIQPCHLQGKYGEGCHPIVYRAQG